MGKKLPVEELILLKAMYNEKLSRAILKKHGEVVVALLPKLIQDSELDWYETDCSNLNFDELKRLHEIDIEDFIELYENERGI